MNEALERPLAIFSLPSDRNQWTWIVMALGVSTVLHGSVALVKTRPVLAQTVDIVSVDIQQATQPPPPELPPPPPPVEKQPEPVAQPTPRPIDNEPPPPPAAAKAGNLLTASEDVPSQKSDMVDFTHGDGNWGDGVVSATGTAIHGAPNASPSGVVGGTGNGPPPPPPPPPAPTVDLSRAAKLIDPTGRFCGAEFYPPEADDDNGSVTMLINIGADGASQSVVIQSESPQGQGFGAAARRCFLSKKRFVPALDRSGIAIGKTQSVTINFSR
jgi:hypothetical protein